MDWAVNNCTEEGLADKAMENKIMKLSRRTRETRKKRRRRRRKKKTHKKEKEGQVFFGCHLKGKEEEIDWRKRTGKGMKKIGTRRTQGRRH